jgi:hypothetical protein
MYYTATSSDVNVNSNPSVSFGTFSSSRRSDTQNSEANLSFYDILVRNALGNYRDVLQEVAFHPKMGQMLTYVGSRSLGYFWHSRGELQRKFYLLKTMIFRILEKVVATMLRYFHRSSYRSEFYVCVDPDENFARELFQLFSIGLVKLNLDGTQTHDFIVILTRH